MAEKKTKAKVEATETTANHVMYPIEELNEAWKTLNTEVAEAMKKFQLVLQSAKQVNYKEEASEEKKEETKD